MSEFLSKFEAATTHDPAWGDRRRRVRRLSDAMGWAEIAVCDEPPNTVRIESLIAEPEGKRVGPRAMKFLCGLADELGTILVLKPLPISRDRSISYSCDPQSNRPTADPGDIAKLRRWYEKFGFTDRRDEPTEMIRQPRARR